MSEEVKTDQEETIDLSDGDSQEVEEPSTISTTRDVEIPTCALCKHAACDQLTEIYFNSNKNIEASKKWFEQKFKRTLIDKTYETHFREHVEPFVSELQVIRKRKLNEIQKTAIENENINFIPIVKHSLLEMFMDVYVSKKDLLKTKEDRGEHSKASKEMVELAKGIREYHQMQLEIMGMGKSEEEQQTAVEEYMAVIVKQVEREFDDMPEAKKRISQLIRIGLGNIQNIQDNEK